MMRIRFSAGGASETLRPTHARLLAEALGDKLTPMADGTLAAPAADVATTAWALRNRYRCRTVRADTRRIALIAQNTAEPVTASCDDATEIAAMLDASRGLVQTITG